MNPTQSLGPNVVSYYSSEVKKIQCDNVKSESSTANNLEGGGHQIWIK